MPVTNTSNYTTLYSTTAGAVAPQQPYGNANVEAFLNVGTDGGNTVQNIVANGTITANGNIESNGFFVGDGGYLTNVSATTSTTANFANYAGNVTVSSQPNITTVGTLLNLNVSGNITANGNITSNANLESINFIANTRRIGIGANAINSTTVNPNSNTIAIGTWAVSNQSDGAIAIGLQAGMTNQGPVAIAIGGFAGTLNQNNRGIAIGYGAAETSQGLQAIAIGSDETGRYTQGIQAIAIGTKAGKNTQGASSVAIGKFAGLDNQGTNAVAIGANAGTTNQANNSIILNATGSNLEQTIANTFTVKPVRNANTANVMFYNNATGEITYDVLNVPSVANANFANFAGNVTNSAQPNITSVGTLVNLTVTGNITSTAGIFNGDGSGLSNINVSNITGNANFANFAGNVTNSAQPNITSVGTLVGLDMGGNITANANITYDIGNSTNRFKDIWLANSTIYLGDANLKSDDSNSTFNVSVTGRANAVVVGNTSANVNTGNLRVGNILITENSSPNVGIALNSIQLPNNISSNSNARSMNITASSIDSLANIADVSVQAGVLSIFAGALGNSNVRIDSATQNLTGASASFNAGSAWGGNNAGRFVNGGTVNIIGGRSASLNANSQVGGQMNITTGIVQFAVANTITGGTFNLNGAVLQSDPNANIGVSGNITLGQTNQLFSQLQIFRGNGSIGNVRTPLINFGAGQGQAITIANGVANLTIGNVTTVDQVFFRTGGVGGTTGVAAGNINNVAIGNITTAQLRMETGSWQWPGGPNVSNVSVTGNFTSGDIWLLTGALNNVTSVLGTTTRGNIRLNGRNVIIETSNTSNSAGSSINHSFNANGNVVLGGSLTVQGNITGGSPSANSNFTFLGDKTPNSSLALFDAQFSVISNNISTGSGYSPFRFQYFDNANAVINPFREFRARGTFAAPAAVVAGDEVSRSVYSVYADSGNTVSQIFEDKIVITQNTGTGTVLANYVINPTNANSNIVFGTSNTYATNMVLSGTLNATGNANTGNVGTTAVVATGNISGANVTVNGGGFLKLATYTAAGLNAITGAAGWMACVTDSAGGGNPNGMIAFWDTTNARWSYVHDNSAV